MRWCIALVTLMLLAPLSSMPAHSQAAPTKPETAESTEWQTLCSDISRSITDRLAALKAAGVKVYAEFGPTRSAAEIAAYTFDRLKGDALPGDRGLPEAAFALLGLATRAPQIYQTLLEDAGIRTRLLELESTSRDQPLFASADSNSLALRLIQELRLLAEQSIVPLGPRPDRDEDVFGGQLLGRIEDRRALIDLLTAASERLRNASEIPVPRFFAATVLPHALKYMDGKLVNDAKAQKIDFAGRLIRYLATQSQGRAYGLLVHFATSEGQDPKSALALTDLFLDATCNQRPSSEYLCLHALSFRIVHLQAIRDSRQLSEARSRLDAAVAQSKGLQLIFSAEAGKAEVRSEAYMEEASKMVYSIPQLDLNSRDHELLFQKFSELRAVSYWVLMAARRRPQQLTELLSPGRTESLEMQSMMVFTFGYIKALELKDAATANVAVGILRAEAAKQLREMGVPPSSIESQAVYAQIDLMELMAWNESGSVENARRVVQRMKTALASAWKRYPQPAPGADGPITCKLPDMAREGFTAREELEVIRATQALVNQLEMRWNVQDGKRVELARIRSSLASELSELFAPRPPPSFSSFGRSDNDSEQRKQASVATFLDGWSFYGKALRPHGDELRTTAVAVKCLLAREEIEERLIADFANKDADSRLKLSQSLYQLIEDSGTSAQRHSAVTEVDFRLLQVAAMLRAQGGVSAAAARSVFPNEEVREQVRKAEIGMAELSHRLNSISALLSGFRMGETLDGMSGLLTVALRYPQAYTRYAELKNQRLATLQSVQDALAGDEAVVLYVPAGTRLLVVVVRKDRSRLTRLDLPLAPLQAASAGLLNSLRLPIDRRLTVPPTFRADLAWTMYQQIWRPLEGALAGAGTVYLVPGDVLARVPFQALLSAPPPTQSQVNFHAYRKMQWLGDRYAFASLPSVHALLRAVSSEKRQSDPKLLAIGEPSISVATLRAMKLDGIPSTTKLLERAGKSGDPEPLLKDRATFSALAESGRRGVVSEADFVLINSHTLPAGKGDLYGTDEAAIVLAPSESAGARGADLLAPLNVMELKLSVRLMMLLACETAGGGADDSSQPFAGLINSFFYAGAGTVLSALQPVSQLATEDLAARFLHHTREGQVSMALALQRAAAEVRCDKDSSACTSKDRVTWAHPAYWSTFMLVGSGR